MPKQPLYPHVPKSRQHPAMAGSSVIKLTEDEWLKRGWGLVGYYHSRDEAIQRKTKEDSKGETTFIDDAWPGYWSVYRKI